MGTAPLLALPPVDPSAPSASNAPATESDAPPDTTAVVLVTAVPAWGPASETITLRVPLLSDVDPGHSVDVRFTLPSTASASSYLIVARVLPADGGKPYSASLFWLRSAGPTAAAPTTTAMTAPAASAVSPATTGTAPAASAIPNAPTSTSRPTATASATPPATPPASLPPGVPGPLAIPIPVTMPAPPRAAGPATEIGLGGVAPAGATSIVPPAVMAALKAAAPTRVGSR